MTDRAQPAQDVVDWALAARVGRTVGGPGPATTPDLRAEVRADFAEFTTLSDSLVREFTGLNPSETAPEPIVVDRAGWVRANADSFRDVIAPVADKLALRAGAQSISRKVMAAVLGVQVGALLGYFSQKVLGQYDLVLSAETGGRVYFVGPNVVEAERKFDLEPRDFRLWIAIHEITHRTQFTAVPWLRERMRQFIEKAVGGFEIDATRVKEIVSRGRKMLLAGPSAWRASNLFSVLMTDEQRALMEEMQALMCVIEGHGTFVMNRIGAEQIASFGDMKGAIEARRGTAGGPEKALQRALGLEMKYEQYVLGEKFMNEVADSAGVDAVNRVWESRDHMPTMDELRAPETWLRRVGA